MAQVGRESKSRIPRDSREITVEELEEVRSRMDQVEEVFPSREGIQSRRQTLYKLHNQNGSPIEYPPMVVREDESDAYENVFMAAVDAGIVLGSIGAIGAYLAGGYGFLPIFVLGVAFLVWARYRGPPREE